MFIDPTKRITQNEIQSHVFFQEINWNEIEDIVDIGVEVIKYSKVRPKSLRKDPFWVKNDKESKHTNQVIDFWPLQDENSNNFGSKRSNEKQVCGRTLSYESTGPHDERYYGSKIYSNIIFFLLKVKW